MLRVMWVVYGSHKIIQELYRGCEDNEGDVAHEQALATGETPEGVIISGNVFQKYISYYKGGQLREFRR